MEKFAYNYAPAESERQSFITKTYAWMGFALLLTAISAFFAAHSYTMMQFLFLRRGYLLLTVAELALVFILSLGIRKLSAGAAAIMFTVYSIVNGLTLSSIFMIYSITSIAWSFLGTAFMYIFMSIYGLTTKQNLTKAGHYLMMALVGVIVVSLVETLVQIFGGIRITALDRIISIVTVVIFTGLTAYDSQKIMMLSRTADSSEAYKKIAVIGALQLYLDFINIFLSLLRIFGRGRD